ncbi:MAG: hypothetical protein ACK55I_25490, partial [bacterium]
GERLVEGGRTGGVIGMQRHQGGGTVHEGHAHPAEVERTAGAGARARDQPRRPQQRQQGRHQGVERDQPGRLGGKEGHDGREGTRRLACRWPGTIKSGQRLWGRRRAGTLCGHAEHSVLN